MKKLKKHLILGAALIGLAIAGTMMAPHPVSASSTSVQIVPNVPFGNTVSGGFGLPSAIKVPSTRHLMIETLSLQVDVTPSGSKIEALINYTSAGKKVSVFIPLTLAYSSANNFDTYIATQPVRLYADPGTSVTFTTFSPSGSQGTSFLTVSGYLI